MSWKCFSLCAKTRGDVIVIPSDSLDNREKHIEVSGGYVNSVT